jgi:AcrR family transcriptional regulator
MMTRPLHKKEAQAQETRRRILRAAVRCFARQGYHKTTIADLSQAIGLTSGAIFHHFATKDTLLEAVIEWLSRGIRVYADINQSAPVGSLAVVEETIRVMCEHFRRNPEATICLAALATELAGSNHPMEKRVKDVYELFIQSFSSTLANHPKVTNPRAAAIALVGSVQGIAIQGLLREGETTIDELAGAFLTMLTEW